MVPFGHGCTVYGANTLLSGQGTLPGPTLDHRPPPAVSVRRDGEAFGGAESQHLIAQEMLVAFVPRARGKKCVPLDLGARTLDRGLNHLPHQGLAGEPVPVGELRRNHVLQVCLEIPDQRELGHQERLVGAQPLLKPFTIIITLLSLEVSLHVFDLMQTMTGGAPYYSSAVLEIYIYRWAFAATIPPLGHASATAAIFGLFVSVIALVQLLGIRMPGAVGSGHDRDHPARPARTSHSPCCTWAISTAFRRRSPNPR